jgi:hypothetical protein
MIQRVRIGSRTRFSRGLFRPRGLVKVRRIRCGWEGTALAGPAASQEVRASPRQFSGESPEAAELVDGCFDDLKQDDPT